MLVELHCIVTCVAGKNRKQAASFVVCFRGTRHSPESEGAAGLGMPARWTLESHPRDRSLEISGGVTDE